MTVSIAIYAHSSTQADQLTLTVSQTKHSLVSPWVFNNFLWDIKKILKFSSSPGPAPYTFFHLLQVENDEK